MIDIEANGLENPTEIWVIVCKDIDSGQREVFRNVTSNPKEQERFKAYSKGVRTWIGHNLLGYDIPVLRTLGCLDSLDSYNWHFVDTLVVSKLVEYSREYGHSLEAYGIELGFAKGKNSYPDFFNKWSQELEDYCVRDVDLTEQIYRKYSGIINDRSWQPAIDLEQRFQQVVNDLHNTGFAFNLERAEKLLEKVTSELRELDDGIGKAFPPRTELVRTWTPRLTKHGTISKSSVPRNQSDLSAYSEGASFCTFVWREFNPSSHKQLIEVLAGAGWRPTDRTKTHIDWERTRESYSGTAEEFKERSDHLSKYGWKINETNLSTLPEKAPKPARLLARRILLESRRRTLTEWLSLVAADGRIHGRFYGIGAWTHRMAHQQPNTANIPNEYDTSGKVKLLGAEMRKLWIAPKRRLLVGVDAEGIQLRIFAHYINDKEFTDALVRGRKEDKTDPHSLNQRILGDHCRSRAAAKRFIYALLLGAGLGKLAEILEATRTDTETALNRLMARYEGFNKLKQEDIPKDARRGYFIGLDGRRVKIPGESPSERRHLCMSGYLQNGETVIMKKATLKWLTKLPADCRLVNFVHDEWQTETPNNVALALEVAKMQADSLREVGEELGLKCPLAGSYWNDDHKDYTVGTNWYQTH